MVNFASLKEVVKAIKHLPNFLNQNPAGGVSFAIVANIPRISRHDYSAYLAIKKILEIYGSIILHSFWKLNYGVNKLLIVTVSKSLCNLCISISS